MWKFIRDVYTVSSLCNWIWKFVRDVYTVSYFVTGYGNLYETYTLFHTS